MTSLQPDQTHHAAGLGISIEGVRRVFPGGVTAIDRADLQISPGEFVSILGPSGCGKSTLLRIIAGLEKPDAGTVAVTGQHAPATPEAADVAYVFQDAHLLPWRSVLRNAELPLELMGADRAPRREAAKQALTQVGLADALDRYPAQLSGGMRMRVSLARALVTKPRLLLLDEPFAALDEITRQRLDEQLIKLWQDFGMTVIFVTHSTAEAAFLSQRAVVMSRRPGRVILDQRLDLPARRDVSTRSDPRMVAATKIIFDALERES